MENMIFGTRAIIEAIKSGKDFDKLYLQTGLNNELSRELNLLVKENNIPVQFVPVEKLNRLTNKNHQGVVGYLAVIVYQTVEAILPMVYEAGKVPLFLLLDRVTDVRNFGAISRSAACAGVDAIIIPSRGSAQINADSLKTSAGALHSLPVCRVDNMKETLAFLKESGLQVIACTEKAKDFYFNCDLSLPTAIIMGSEEDGISPEYLKMSDGLVKIPMTGSIASLNVSVATGIILFDVVRQRSF